MTRITIIGRNCDISKTAFQTLGRGLALLGGPAEAGAAWCPRSLHRESEFDLKPKEGRHPQSHGLPSPFSETTP